MLTIGLPALAPSDAAGTSCRGAGPIDATVTGSPGRPIVRRASNNEQKDATTRSDGTEVLSEAQKRLWSMELPVRVVLVTDFGTKNCPLLGLNVVSDQINPRDALVPSQTRGAERIGNEYVPSFRNLYFPNQGSQRDMRGGSRKLTTNPFLYRA